MMTAEQYDAAQQQLLQRQRCLIEHRMDLAIVRVEADREIARLANAIVEDQRQVDDLAVQIAAFWDEAAHLPEVDA